MATEMTNPSFNLTDTDKKIIEIILKDARLSSRHIARLTNISVGTVITRIKNMEANGLIKGYTAQIDHEKLGYTLTAIIEITLSKSPLLEVENEIAKMPGICNMYNVTGSTDVIVVAKFKNKDELINFTNQLLTLPYVEHTNTHITLTTIKENNQLLP